MKTENSFMRIIQAKEVEAEHQKIISALLAGGYDAQDQDFNYPAAQRKVAEICDEAFSRGIAMAEPNWVLNEDGDVEVGLAFYSLADMIFLKLVIA
jgi:hypothetical protein